MAGVLHTTYGRTEREMIHDYHRGPTNSFEYWLAVHLQSLLATTTMLLLQAFVYCDFLTANGAQSLP
jgi:hypothetical protein